MIDTVSTPRFPSGPGGLQKRKEMVVCFDLLLCFIMNLLVEFWGPDMLNDAQIHLKQYLFSVIFFWTVRVNVSFNQYSTRRSFSAVPPEGRRPGGEAAYLLVNLLKPSPPVTAQRTRPWMQAAAPLASDTRGRRQMPRR